MSVADLMYLQTIDDKLLAFFGFLYALFGLFCVSAMFYGFVVRIKGKSQNDTN